MDGKKTYQIVNTAGIARTFQNIRLFKKMTVHRECQGEPAIARRHTTYSLTRMLHLPHQKVLCSSEADDHRAGQ